MMRRNVDTTLTIGVCQLASLLVILSTVLGMLAQEITRGAAPIHARESLP